jgi:hypothetical protein
MHKPSIAQLVYEATFPRPRTTDPASFSAHITRNLVPEVRIETAAFYGALDCIEAQYPGLDYSSGPHRMRLGRFPWHRKLFKVFDELALTVEEISSLCRWEGTKSARERYEKEEGVIVRDTTAENVPQAPNPPLPSIVVHPIDPEAEYRKPDARVRANEEAVDMFARRSDIEPENDEEESSDEEMESCGVELNQRLLVATAARERGVDVPLDEDWEQWLKETIERGNYSDMINAIRNGQPLNLLSNPSPPTPHSASTATTPSPTFSGQLFLSTQANMIQPVLHPNSALRTSANHASETAM